MTASRFTGYAALACVCFFWGTTYLGIRIAVQDLPPATLMCVRYLLSGSVMLIAARLRAVAARLREQGVSADARELESLAEVLDPETARQAA